MKEIAHIIITPGDRQARTTHATVLDAIDTIRAAIDLCLTDEHAYGVTLHVIAGRSGGEPVKAEAPSPTEPEAKREPEPEPEPKTERAPRASVAHAKRAKRRQ